FAENEVAQVGDVIGVIEIEGEETQEAHQLETPASGIPGMDQLEESPPPVPAAATSTPAAAASTSRFYSPLVKSIAAEEGITEELDRIPGTGSDGRVTKQDILDYLEARKDNRAAPVDTQATEVAPPPAASRPSAVSDSVPAAPAVIISPTDEIIEMDRMRRLIADHMVKSVQIAPHVCSFVEADVTNLVNWRNKIKASY